MKFVFSILLVLINLSFVFSQDTVRISDHLYHIDLSKKLIVVNAYTNTINNEIKGSAGTVFLDDYYSLSASVNSFEIGNPYILTSKTNVAFTLYFTRLPIIHVETTYVITDEPRRFARFRMTDGSELVREHNMGINLSGLSTLTQEKKNYRIEFWHDSIGAVTKDVSLMGMRSDDDWNLKSVFNEPLRVRSKVGYELWRRINNLYYASDEIGAINGVRTEYAELFLNNRYQGVYLVSERIDRKQLRIKKTDNDRIRGELYKGISWGASTFHECPEFDNEKDVWSGYEIRYPDDRIYWNNIHDLVDFVVNSTESHVLGTWQDRFVADNTVDYFIFANLLRATDNMGKNIFTARYDENEPYFFVPWDLDGTLGTIWNGYREDISNDILKNGFYKKLFKDKSEGGFTDKLTKRWNELRNTVIDQSAIMELFSSNYNFLLENGVYEREELAWPDSHRIDQLNLEYSSNWLSRRLLFLDQVFNNPDLLLTTNTVDVYSDDNKMSIYPNPAIDHIIINNQLSTTIQSVSIRNAAGQVLLITNQLMNGNKLDISALPQGLYLVSFHLSDRSIQTQKIIKK